MEEKKLAREGVISDGVKSVAALEGIEPGFLSQKVAEGRAVILKHRERYVGIGEGLSVKVNANIGTSPDVNDVSLEIEKLGIACKHGADAVMDLSTGGDINRIRREIVEKSTVPVGTVPIYQAVVETIEEKSALIKMDSEKIFQVLEEQARDGISFATLHCGITLNTLERIKKNPREAMVVSRGGAFLTSWMIANGKENPLYERFDRVIDIAKRYGLILSLGDGMRPGSIADSTDIAQIDELLVLGELVKICHAEDVQVITEGPGHVPINEVSANVLLQKKICRGAPFYVLGPIVTDSAPGYDHITSAIGGAIAGLAGADFICYVTPSEHISLPGVKEVEEGVIAARIAAHAADIGRGNKKALRRDCEISEARTRRDWEAEQKLSINPERFNELREKSRPSESDVCTMCGRFCAIKTVEKYLNTRIVR